MSFHRSLLTGMLLAAGRGERMEPLSSLIPKPTLPVLDRPLLAASLKALWGAGCQAVVVNLHRHPEQVAAAVREVAGGRKVLFSFEPQLLGPAGGLTAARGFYGEGPVLVANADSFPELDLSPLMAAGGPDKVVLGLLPHSGRQRWSAVHLGEEGRVVRITRPGESQKGYLFSGFQLIGPQALAWLPPAPAPMSAFWQPLMARGRLFGVVLDGQFWEAGDPQAYWELVMSRLQGGTYLHPQAWVHPKAELSLCAVSVGVRVAAGACVRSSILLPGAQIGEGARLESCVVRGFVAPGDWYCCKVLVGDGKAAPLASLKGQRATTCLER